MATALTQALDTHLQNCYTEEQPGAAILVTRVGEVLYEGCIGLMDLNTREPITPATNFRLASVSKQFTAKCVQLLQQQGLLQYTNRLSSFFPELAHLGSDISIAHLLNHTSGLPDYEGFVADTRQEQVHDREVLTITASQPHLLFAPGSQYRYSNTGYVLLALVVEKVSGMAYAEFLSKYIFKPLSMSNTVLYEAGKPIPNRAIGYAVNAAGEMILSDQSVCSATKGDGCIYTSLRDYLKWHEALQQQGFNIEGALQSINTNIEGNPALYYGMGWFFTKRSNGSLEMYHSGNTCGFSNLVIRVPESQLLIACFSNIADNPHLLTNFINVLQQHPKTRLESDLICRLLHLTR
ncbi:serine hydrolase domain-containing protein [Pontibacter cellulosilyticus]|uniref:Beta-lactamase family protein n=1 Tax=Pontibacter cellulosilyticus TaxID=1720253 RepID=A0A923N5V4_9BACT|nr:serine hydrolase domain-containing protein [Pontibacter cellulosilyticus]MBC5992384.1 beta-lactamase family protein [Pontibacter cellulosilyticus]